MKRQRMSATGGTRRERYDRMQTVLARRSSFKSGEGWGGEGETGTGRTRKKKGEKGRHERGAAAAAGIAARPLPRFTFVYIAQ